MFSAIQDRLVELLPSEGLKNKIRETAHRFSAPDLLAIAYQYAPDFDTRISLLGELAELLDGKLKADTERVIQNQTAMLREFKRPAAHTVYELHIHETPDAYDERCLCASFDACLKMIPLFYREYGGAETSRARYEITKRKLFSAEAGEAFAEDELGSLVLLPGGKLYSAALYGMDPPSEECGGDCLNCDRLCLSSREILFPCFTKDTEAVRYTDPSGAVSYGIVLQSDDQPRGDCYIIPMDCDAISYHDFENVHNAHRHIPCPMVEAVPADELPEGMKRDYELFLSFYRSRPSPGFG